MGNRFGPVASILLATSAVLISTMDIQSADSRMPPDQEAAPSPESRAIAFLVREVPDWPQRKQCFSCHNNGDAARTLYLADKHGYEFDRQALATTTSWVQTPEKWAGEARDDQFAEPALAVIQFASALETATRDRPDQDRGPLIEAARIIVRIQEPDGSWKVSPPSLVGSPVTYGHFLATTAALRVLQSADKHQFSEPISRSERWLRTTPPQTILDAGALLLALGRFDDPEASAQKLLALKLIEDGRDKSGGWGPYVISQPEPFDTAIVLLGLSQLEDADMAEMISGGRQYLIRTQLPDGSWTETTRPAGAESYAQRMSTTAWATQALLATAAE